MHRYLIIVWIIFLSCDCLSQQYPFVHYTPKDGLVNSRVREIYQDSRGRLYFLSYGGLSVYDGNRFRNYTIQNGLSADMVNDIVEVGDDSLLVATNINEMNLLVRGQMKKFIPADKFCPTINYFLKCQNGNIYITADQGLYMLKDNKFEDLKLSIPNMKDAPFLGAIAEWNDQLIFSTNDLRNNTGLFTFNKKTRQLTDLMPDSAISFLEKDKAGRLWVCTPGGIYNLDTLSLKNGKLKFLPPTEPYNRISKYGNCPLTFDDNHVWLINQMKDLIKVGDDGSLIKIDLQEQFPGVSIGSLFIDRENIAWISTSENGVVKLTGTNLTIGALVPGKKVPDLLNRAFHVNDTTWLIVNFNKLARKTNAGAQLFTTSFSRDIHFIEQLGGKLIAADQFNIYESPIPGPGTNHLSFRKTFTSKSSLGVERLIEENGNIIISSRPGITIIQNNKQVFEYPIPHTDAVEGIKRDAKGRLLVITRYMGIIVFTIHPDDPEHYLKPLYHFEKELDDISPRSVTFDKSGKIWIGTRFNGVIAYELNGAELKPIHQFQVQQGLTDNFITSLACDSSNNIIVGSPTGMDRLVLTGKNEYRIENITKSNNIFGSFENLWVDKKGNIHGIMGSNSLLQFSPPAPNKSFTPQLFIEEIKVNGQPFWNYEKTARLSHSQRNLSLTLAAPAFLNEKQVQYTYRLLGTDNDEWSEPSTNANINLLNLSPGKYTLNVKAFFPSTPYGAQQISYDFIISPPWWETWLFRGLVAIAFIGLLVYMIRFYYSRKMEKQRIALEKQKAIEIERTRIAHDIHDDLGAGLSTIRFLSEKVKLNAANETTKTDIEKMQLTSNDLMEKMNEIIWAMNEKNDTLEDLLFYTRAYAKEYCEENGLQCSFDIPENIPLLFVSGEVRRNVFLIVKESLHNIVKHAFASEVNFKISVDRNLSIKVRDNGRGIETKKINLNGGNGLQIMQKRMGSIGGTLAINTQNGTSIEMDVPLAPPDGT